MLIAGVTVWSHGPYQALPQVNNAWIVLFAWTYICLNDRGAILAVLAEDAGFWLCRANSDVWLDADTFSACWLEPDDEQSDLYKKQNWVVKLELSSLLARVKMVRDSGLLRLPKAERLRLESLLKKLEDGFKLQAYDKDHEQVSQPAAANINLGFIDRSLVRCAQTTF